MKINRIVAAALAWLAGSLLFASPGHAQALVCGISGSSTAASVNYDPFNPTGLGTTTIQLTIKRVNNGGGSFTRLVRFYLKAQNNGADGTVITPTAVVGPANYDGLNLNIFYNYAGGAPTLTGNPSAANRFLLLDFTGNNAASDTVVVTFNVTLPPNLDLAASGSLAFDVHYACTANPNTAASGIISNAVVFPIKVLSALQASYVGTALDFGEVGDKTTAAVLLAPATYSTPASGNHVRVLSSGPYKVEMSSQNAFRLTFPGGNPGTAAQRLNYKALFLGQTVSNGSPAFTAVTCARAGVPAAQADLLPIRATLLEGGDGKQVSPDYKDVITVTVSPLAVGPVGVDCPSVVLPTP